MISGLDLSQTADYILPYDKENPTIWKLGIVPGDIFSKIHRAGGDSIDIAYKYLQFALRGIENSPIKFETVVDKSYGREIDIVPMSVLGKIAPNDISALYVEAVTMTKLTEKEIKNS